MVIKFKKNWFNPLYFILNDALKDNPRINKVFIYGSKSSAKTLTIGSISQRNVILIKQMQYVLGRKVVG